MGESPGSFLKMNPQEIDFYVFSSKFGSFCTAKGFFLPFNIFCTVAAHSHLLTYLSCDNVSHINLHFVVVVWQLIHVLSLALYFLVEKTAS